MSTHDNDGVATRARAIAEAATGTLGDTFTKEIREQLASVREDGLGALNLDDEGQADLLNTLEEELRIRGELLEDLRKAQWYLDRLVKEVSNGAG